MHNPDARVDNQQRALGVEQDTPRPLEAIRHQAVGPSIGGDRLVVGDGEVVGAGAGVVGGRDEGGGCHEGCCEGEGEGGGE